MYCSLLLDSVPNTLHKVNLPKQFLCRMISNREEKTAATCHSQFLLFKSVPTEVMEVTEVWISACELAGSARSVHRFAPVLIDQNEFFSRSRQT